MDGGNIGESEGWAKVACMGCGPSDGEAGTEKLVQASLRQRVPPTAGRGRLPPGPLAQEEEVVDAYFDLLRK